MSMKHADSDSVLGDFNNATFIFKDKRTIKPNTFFKKGEQFWVNIQDDDGLFHDYQIKYTFGYKPLQQYMVEFNDGRVQLIPFAWDSRAKTDGGQRWFNLYPEFTKNHQDFFWTNTGQNWNYMCADCHSTNVKKNFDIDSNSYQTSFSEINVACESCHGAASEHISWTKDKKINNFGFNRDLSTSVKHWQSEKGKTTLTPARIKNTQQVLTCAQCHSRRTQISNNAHITANKENNAFGERYLLDLITSENYYADGQVYNENFVYGSFLQSKMYQKGVVCSDCHNPHTAKLKFPIDTLCLQCHQADNYASNNHHKHPESSNGAHCVNCHMPQTTYMKIDARRDHGFHIPRPDLALQLGTPDTCLSCHEDKDSNWSLSNVNAWFPNTEQRIAKKQQKDYAAVFSATTISLSNKQWQSVASELSRIAQTLSYAPIIRASALTKMADTSNTNTIIAIARGLKNDNELIRLGAVIALQGRGAQEIQAQKWRLLSPLLTDKVLTVRTSSAFALASLWQQLNQAQQKQLTPALNEYITSQDFNNDRSFAHTNKGIIYSYQGKFKQAIQSFKQGIIIEPYFAPAYINLSQVHRQLKQNQQAIAILKQGVDANPENPQLPFELAMAFIRAKDKPTAANYLHQATQLAPQNSHYFYVLGLSLEQQNKSKAYKALTQAYKLSQNPQHLYALCEMQIRHKTFQAKQCLNKLAKVAPANVIEQLNIQLNDGRK
ncbi:tetratricopeptide repeat protein [Candidatus Colwellia aromaticivorans]|uniref:tetratricopeptide repeat protein n=1 Tax=Candidatus Colwellia aromaticivorans TaxID=2267621 RepID=UPI001FECD305